MPPVIALEQLTHAYRAGVVALNDLTLDIESGVTGLVGANGAGKTTMLRILLGLLHPTAGSAKVFGHDALSEPLAVRALVGYMPETACLPKDQTAADFVAFSAEIAGVPAKDARRRSSETLFLVGLEEERFRYLGDFSTGMQQRVKLAQSIVHGPRLVLLDEPASGLDPAGRQQMLDLIRRLGGFGINVVMSSHVLSDIEETCSNVVMLDGGRLIRSGPLERHEFDATITVETTDDPLFLAENLRRLGFEAVVAGQTVTLGAGDDAVFDVIRDLAADSGTGILRLGRTSITLEDEFLSSALQ